MRVLIDTCVIVDALQSRKPFDEAAQRIFIYSANQQFEGYITAKSVTDIYYLTHRLTHSDSETRRILSKLFTLFHLLDTTWIVEKRYLLKLLIMRMLLWLKQRFVQRWIVL